MAGTRADVTSDVNEAMQAREGTRFCHCVEMTFGQAIRARPGDATKADTEVIWTGRGDLTKLHVYTSIDDGLTWQRVGRSGDPIPLLAVNAAGQYSAAYAVTTNRRVAARIVFENGASAVLDTFTLRATYEDGSIIERVETGADLADDRVVNVRYDAGVGGLQAFPDVSMRFFGNRGGAINPTVHGGDSAKTGMHLSHGNYAILNQGSVIEWQADEPDRLAHAAMAFEGWFYTEKTTGMICGWTTTPSRANLGTSLELIETSATGAKLRFRTTEWQDQAPIRGLQAPAAETGDDAIRLNQWHHFAFSYDGFWATVYLDGVVFSRVAFRATRHGAGQVIDGEFERPFGIVIATNGKFAMGRSPLDAQNVDSTASSFQGRLSEWRFYTKPLTAGALLRRRFRRLDAAEVATMVAADGLQAYFRFNEGVGQTVPDSSGNALHLQWHQQQVAGGQLPPQMAWLPFSEIWRGFPISSREVGPGSTGIAGRSPGRQTATLDLDHRGDVIRATDAPFDVVFDGKTFTGVGACGGIETIQEAGDLVPTSVTLTLSGVAPQNIALALSTRYLDRPCRIWQVTFADDGTQLDPFLVFDGRLDEMAPSFGHVGTIRVTAESHLRNWRRPKHRRWNDEGQRSIWPDDHFLEFLAAMVDKQVWWPVQVSASAGFVAVALVAGLAAAGWLAAWGLW